VRACVCVCSRVCGRERLTVFMTECVCMLDNVRAYDCACVRVCVHMTVRVCVHVCDRGCVCERKRE
jgi:hypothetical protein